MCLVLHCPCIGLCGEIALICPQAAESGKKVIVLLESKQYAFIPFNAQSTGDI